MSVFNQKTITNKGMELIAAGLTGGSITFKNIVLGSGTYTGNDLAAQDALVKQEHSLNITNVVRRGSLISLTATLLPNQITQAYAWSELGVIAEGATGGDILYLYGYSTQTSIISPTNLDERIIEVSVLVSNVQNVQAVIDNSLVFLTRKDLEDHNQDPTAHDDIRQELEQVKQDINNIDVKTDVEEVINRRVNDDVTKPLNKLLDDAKNAIINLITTVRDAIIAHINTKTTEINNNTNAARDNIKTHITTETKNLADSLPAIIKEGSSKVASNDWKITINNIFDISNIWNDGGNNRDQGIYLGTMNINDCDKFRVQTSQITVPNVSVAAGSEASLTLKIYLVPTNKPSLGVPIGTKMLLRNSSHVGGYQYSYNIDLGSHATTPGAAGTIPITLPATNNDWSIPFGRGNNPNYNVIAPGVYHLFLRGSARQANGDLRPNGSTTVAINIGWR